MHVCPSQSKVKRWQETFHNSSVLISLVNCFAALREYRSETSYFKIFTFKKSTWPQKSSYSEIYKFANNVQSAYDADNLNCVTTYLCHCTFLQNLF